MLELNEIHNYLVSIGYKKKDLNEYDRNPQTLAFEISAFAHRNQKRENGETYFLHPLRCFDKYEKLINENVNMELLMKNDLPHFGVVEVCVLHDVVEDTNITIDDIGYIYSLMNLRAYFDNNIRTSLINITHNKNEDYQDYIFRCMEHPTSALVKMIDLNDNLNVLSLISLDDKKFNRCVKYLTYIKLINDEFSFLEKINAYNKERNQKVIQSN